jgi:NADH dehydrogenase
MRWILIEATDHVLPEVPKDLADYAVAQLRGRGIDIRLGTRIEEATANSVLLSTGERVPTKMLVWTAGVKPHPSLASMSVPLNETGRVIVDQQMRVEGMRGVWAVGDCAAVPHPDGSGRPCPPTAAMAVRQGPAVAHNVACELGVSTTPRSFEYLGREAFVNLGRYKAVGKIGRLKFRGFVAWWMARSYHMSQIPGLARKIRAVVDWTVGLPFARDTAEVGSIGHPEPLADEVYAHGGTHRPVPD